MQRVLAILSLSVLLLSGCATPTSTDDPIAPDDDPILPPGSLDADGKTVISRIEDRAALNFTVDPQNLPWSITLNQGVFDILPGIGKFVTVDMPLGTGLPSAEVHMGLFFPDIEGCDWGAHMDVGIIPGGGDGTAGDLPEHCQLPVVADVGPYFGQATGIPALSFDPHATQPANRLGKFLIENLVPHGYIVAQVSVTGTGDSTGCMDLMGPVEQAGVQGAVRYLGDAPWSNGNVGLIGRSYDGSTPFEAAMAEDLPQLKTIVPISGLYGQFDLMWKNGSVELRGPGVLWGLYYAFTYTGNQANPSLAARQIIENALCPETQTGGAVAAGSYIYGGDPIRPYQEEGGYWEERSFKAEVLENYKGSVYFIHGMQDWNVDTHMAFPFYQELQDQGLEVKGLFGQWAHHYPDRVSEHPNNIRWDWAQDLLEWFDHYLKETGAKPQLVVEMEDDHYQWRIEETWPPADLQWTPIEVDGAGQSVQPFGQPVRYNLGVLSEDKDLHISGLPQFHVDVTPAGPGGQIGLRLLDATENNRRLGHAIMDLRYADGGVDMTPVIPGQTITAKMEFLPFDAFVPAGHELVLEVTSTVCDYLASSVSSEVTIEQGTLRLPIVERDGSTFYYPPGLEPYEGDGYRTACSGIF